jgi:hypothetical protein
MCDLLRSAGGFRTAVVTWLTTKVGVQSEQRGSCSIDFLRAVAAVDVFFASATLEAETEEVIYPGPG